MCAMTRNWTTVYQSWLSCFCISVDWPWNLLVMGSNPVWGSKTFLSASTAVYHSQYCASSCSSQQMKWSVQWTTCTVNAVMDRWWYLWRLATPALSFKNLPDNVKGTYRYVHY